MSKLLLLLLAVVPLLYPAGAAAQQVPESFIAEGLQNNLVLREKNIALEQSMLALKEAKSLFLPTTWFEGQYTIAKGGRSIDLPVGDLLNPVYKTLNQLTNTHDFPQIANVKEQFLPNNFYDVRVKTTMPILNPDLKYNRSIRQQQVQLTQSEIDTYRRELVKEIKTAYYQYLQAENAVRIYRNALDVVQQNLKVNQSLLRNGKGLPAYISRSESEVQQVESQLQEAQNAARNAGAYFNFLLNKPLESSIDAAGADAVEELSLPPVLTGNIRSREELNSLKIAADINRNVDKMNRSYRSPRLAGFVDLASQGFNFEVNDKSVFYLAGVQVQVPIFSGKRNQYKIEQSGLQGKAINLQKQYTEQQLELSAMVSRNNAVSAYGSYQASRKQQQSAQQYFRLVDKGYKEGVNSFIELLDARTSLTNAQLQTNIQHFKVLAALADYERQTASYTFK